MHAFPALTEAALLLLRLLVMLLAFVWSGWGHAKDPVASGKTSASPSTCSCSRQPAVRGW